MSYQIENLIETFKVEREGQQVTDKPVHILDGRQFLAALLAIDHSKKEIEELLKEHFGE